MLLPSRVEYIPVHLFMCSMSLKKEGDRKIERKRKRMGGR